MTYEQSFRSLWREVKNRDPIAIFMLAVLVGCTVWGVSHLVYLFVLGEWVEALAFVGGGVLFFLVFGVMELAEKGVKKWLARMQATKQGPYRK